MTEREALGTMGSPVGDRIDFARLRRDRRRRLFDAMAAHHLDALVLGRPANVAYATGARQLWTAGTRPFGPACVVVGGTGRTHLLSTWDEGVPDEISRDDLFGLSWNPANVAASVAAIAGLASARRIGTDSLSPGFSRLLTSVARQATVVDGGPALSAARASKSGDELAAIATATAVAESGLAAMLDALRPGVTERELLGTYLARIASLGAPTPPTEGVVCATSRRGPVQLRRLATDRPIGPDELVVVDSGGFFAGYEGGVGRTWPAGPSPPSVAQRELAARCRELLGTLCGACRAGATGAELRATWEHTGEPLPPWPFVHSIGLGAEPPVIGAGIGSDATLVAGTVLSVSAWVTADGVGGFFERELILVSDGDPQVRSRFGRGPAAEGGP